VTGAQRAADIAFLEQSASHWPLINASLRKVVNCTQSTDELLLQMYPTLLALAVLVGIAVRRPPPPAVTVLAPAPSLPLPPARTVVVAAVSAPRTAPPLPAPTRVRARGVSPVRAALREPPREAPIAPSAPPPRPVINGAPIVD
jgi:hypothetical protein